MAFPTVVILMAGAIAAGYVGADDDPSFGRGDWEITVTRGIPKGDRGEAGENGGVQDVSAEPESRLRFRGKILGFGTGGLRIQPAIAPDRELDFKMSQLVAINRIADEDEGEKDGKSEPEEEPETDGLGAASYIVTLNDGGEFSGHLKAFDAGTTTLEAGAFGILKIPTKAVRSIARDDDRFAEPTLPDVTDEAVAKTETGEIFRGEIGTEAGDPQIITVTGTLMRAHFPLGAVGRIDFRMDGGLESEGAARSEFEIALADGGRLIGSRIDLDGREFGVAMRSGLVLALPISRVDSIYPVQSGGNNLGTGVLMWGGYSDPAEEYAHTRTSVEGGGLKIDEITEQIPASDLRRRLFRSRAFLIPEMEQLNPGMLEDEVEFEGRKVKLRDYFSDVMRPDLEKFMAAGGHVVFTGVQGNHFEILKLLGFDEIQNATDRDGSEFKISPEIQRRLRMEHDTLTPANATHCYEVPDGWEVLAGQEGKKAAAAISKSMQRGRVTIIGADFYETNPSLDELLQRTLQLSR